MPFKSRYLFPKNYFIKYGVMPCIFLSFLLVSNHTLAQERYEALRLKMVDEQIIARGVTDAKVVKAMKNIERHLFVPEEYIPMAYADRPLPIGYSQTISQPYIVAYMTEMLDLKPGDRVLEIGTGSGYQAAVLAEICDKVYTIEVVSPLGERARSLLKKLGYSNVVFKIGDGYKGWGENAPFDAIIITCSPTHIPEPLQKQLAEGGRMIIPVGERYVQQLVYLVKKDGKLHRKAVLPVSFVPMVDEKGKTY